MFKFLTDSVENALDVAHGVIDPFGNPPTKRQVAKLIADGMTVYAAAEAWGVGVDVIEALLEDDSDPA